MKAKICHIIFAFSFIFCGSVLLLGGNPVYAATFSVSETGDQADFSAGDGLCDYDNVTVGSQCTLRAAIQEANALAGTDTIAFNIPTSDAGYRDYDMPNTASSGDSTGGDDYWTIRPTSVLPTITTTVNIDGATQTTNQGDFNTAGPEIELAGTNLGAGSSGLNVTGLSVAVNSIVINRFESQILLSATTANNFVVTRSYFGVDVQALADFTTTQRYGVNVNAIVTGVRIGNDTTDGNVFGGFDLNPGVVEDSGVHLACGTGVTAQQVEISGNYFGMNPSGTVALPNYHSIWARNNCDLVIGGDTSAKRNYIGESKSAGLFLRPANSTLPNMRVFNNYFGVDASATQSRPNVYDVLIAGAQNYTGAQNPIKIGDAGKGNLFVGATSAAILSNSWRAWDITYNSIIAYRGIQEISTAAPFSAFNGVNISNNYIARSTSSDPYFGVAANPAAQSGPSQGINSERNPVIKGNRIVGHNNALIIWATWSNTFQYLGLSQPTLGGTSAFAGSLCNGLEQNCLEDLDPYTFSEIPGAWPAYVQLFSNPIDTAAFITNNDVSDLNPSDTLISNFWHVSFEVFSGTNRRTDLADNSIDVVLPSNYPMIWLDASISNYKQGTTIDKRNWSSPCVTPANCPAAGATTGVAGRTMAIKYLNGSTFFYTYLFSLQNETRVDGTVVNAPATIKLESNHWASQTFSFDGDSTTHPLVGDRGEVWTNDVLADGDINDGSVGAVQTLDVDYVDANPIWNGSEWVITVDSTTDEDNVSTCGVNDGSGAYSGGGCGGTGGLPNGRTSLREAIIVANNHAGPNRIAFDIPTTDAGYRDYDTPNTASSGDGVGGDDYWSIRPATDLPSMTGETDLDGATQTSAAGNLNVTGPEIEIRPQTLKTQTGPSFGAGSDNSSINAIAIFGFGPTTNNTIVGVTSSGFTFSNSYIGLDAIGLGTVDPAVGWGYGLRFNNAAGNNLILNSRIAGVQDAITLITCSPGSLVEIKGTIFGLNSSGMGTTAKNARGINTNSSDNCHLIIGGDNPSDRNIISNTAGQGVYHSFADISGEPNTKFEIYNNFFGTDATGTVSIPNGDVDIRFQGSNYDGPTPQIIIGGENKGNLFRFSQRAVWFNNPVRDAVVEYNSFGDHNNRSILIDAPNAANHGQIIIRHNFIGQTSSDPYFGLAIGANAQRGIQMRAGSTDLIIESNEIYGCGTNGIEINSGGSHSIIGNRIEDCEVFGIYVTGENIDVRNNTSTDLFSDPTIGGTSNLIGSRCGNTQRNCINGNALGGIYSMDTVPANEATLYPDNDFTGGNGAGDNVNIEQAWYGLYELFSSSRRTDLPDGSFQMAIPSMMALRDFNFAPVSTFSNLTLQCIADPLTNTYCTGANAAPGVTNRTGYSAFWAPSGATLTNSNTWYRVTEYRIDALGNKAEYSSTVTPNGFESLHLVARNFSFDGNGTTQTVSGDRGERWTDAAAAARNISTGDFSRFQIMEIDYVDANPIWSGTEWVITVDSTSDEDNVSTCGVNDGDGVYSGGGCNGPDGLPNGRTSLREALAVAQNHAGFERIAFNIPTTDSGWNTGSFPNAFVISVGSNLFIPGNVEIDGDSQALITGDTAAAQISQIDNTLTTGPEINLDFGNAAVHIQTEGSNILVERLGFHNSTHAQRAIEFSNVVNDLQIRNSTFTNNLWGPVEGGYVGSSDVAFSRNVVRGGGGGASFYNIDNLQVLSNRFYASCANCVQIYDGDNLSIRNNTFRSISGQSAINVFRNTSNTLVSNNKIYDGTSRGIILQQATAMAELAGNQIWNNSGIAIDLNVNNVIDAKDAGDGDSGANNSQNYPEITEVEYLGGSTYRVSGVVDGRVSEAPFQIEICLSEIHGSGHGNCVQTLGTTNTSSTPNSISGSSNIFQWSKVVTVAGSNGVNAEVFSALATNDNKATSEFGKTFEAGTSNPDYSVGNLSVTLAYPINEQKITQTQPFFDWTVAGFPEVASYQIYIDQVFYATVNGNTTQFSNGAELALGQHKWQVVAYRNNPNGGGVIEIGRSNTEAFEIVEEIIPAPPIEKVEGKYPINITIDTFEPSFYWEYFGETDLGEFELKLMNASKTVLFTQKVSKLEQSNLGTYTLTGAQKLPAEGTYYWQVSFSANGSTVSSPEYTFEVKLKKLPPSIPVNEEKPNPGPSTRGVEVTSIIQIVALVNFVITALLLAIKFSPELGALIEVGLMLPFMLLYGFGKERHRWGIVAEAGTGKRLAGLTVRLFNSNQALVDTCITHFDGSYGFVVVENGEYTVQIVHEAYELLLREVSIVDDLNNEDKGINLELIENFTEPGKIKRGGKFLILWLIALLTALIATGIYTFVINQVWGSIILLAHLVMIIVVWLVYRQQLMQLLSYNRK